MSMSTLDRGSFGDRLRLERLRRSLTQQELAALAGVHWVTLHEWEVLGRIPMPAAMHRLLAALDEIGVPPPRY